MWYSAIVKSSFQDTEQRLGTSRHHIIPRDSRRQLLLIPCQYYPCLAIAFAQIAATTPRPEARIHAQLPWAV